MFARLKSVPNLQYQERTM